MHFHKGKLRFLAVKLSALESELAISREILESAAREVDTMFKQKYFPEIPNKQEGSADNRNLENTPEEASKANSSTENDTKEEVETDQEEGDTQKAQNKQIDPEVKSLFRKISLKIHPDKLEQMPPGFEKEKKEKLYQKACAAHKNNDILLLADVAMELEIEIPEISEEKLKQAEEKILTIKKELHHIESTLVWQWFFVPGPEAKDQILSQIFEAMYANHSRS